MKTDRVIQHDVMEELTFDPSIAAENIGVSVKDQVVTLSGFVPTYAEKFAAEKAAFRVAGVRAVAEEIKVKLPGQSARTDQDLAKAAADALQWNVSVPATVQTSVEDGKIILRGQVDWSYQRDAAATAVRYLKGLKEVVNHIKVQARPIPQDVKDKIEKALIRTASDDAHHIAVNIADGKVTLSGKVHSHHEIEDARFAAWSVPGVKAVETHIILAQ